MLIYGTYISPQIFIPKLPQIDLKFLVTTALKYTLGIYYITVSNFTYQKEEKCYSKYSNFTFQNTIQI